MSTISCPCGRNFDQPSDPRRFRCPSCARIYDPRRLDWDSPQEGVATPGDIEPDGLDRPMDTYAVDWRYGPEDLERIRWGLRPGSMDDKWFVCLEGNEVRIHRSWTGVLGYRVALDAGGIRSVSVGREMPDHPWQVKLARWVLESKLIGLDVPPP